MTKDKDDEHLPWLKGSEPDVEGVVKIVVDEFIRRKTAHAKPVNLSKKHEEILQKDYNQAQQARSKADVFMRALAKKIGVGNIESNICLAPMKDWCRASEKFNAAAEDRLTPYDLGRGRIYIDDYKDNPGQYHGAIRCLEAHLGGGNKRNASSLGVKAVAVKKISNYIQKSRQSGFAGSINAKLLVDNKKGREGAFELQVMPRACQLYDKHSHIIYDMMRIIEAVPDYFRTDAQNSVYNGLHNANRSLFYEYRERSGFNEVCEDPEFSMSERQLRESWEILDRVRTALEDTKFRDQKRQPKWYKDSLDALTYSKTSLGNAFLGIHKSRRENEYDI